MSHLGNFDWLEESVATDPSLLRIPLENIDRWLANGHTAPHRLEQWRSIIVAAERPEPQAMHTLLKILRTPDPDDERLLDFSPFAGILNRKERRETESRCVFNF